MAYKNGPKHRTAIAKWQKSPKGRATLARWRRKERQRIAAFIAEYKATHPCIDCGERDPVVLQFDHVHGNKKCNVSGCGSVRELKREIAKCVIRCANDHARKTAREGELRHARRQKPERPMSPLPLFAEAAE